MTLIDFVKNDALYKFCRQAGHHLQFPNEFLSFHIVFDLPVFCLVIVFDEGFVFYSSRENNIIG